MFRNSKVSSSTDYFGDILVWLILYVYIFIHTNSSWSYFMFRNTNSTTKLLSLTHTYIFGSWSCFLYRIEKVKLNRRDGISKVAGTLACVFGASVITLYKGPVIFSPSKTLNHVNNVDPSPVLWLEDPKGKSWTLGCVYLVGHCLSWSGWLVLQAPVLKKYPARLSVTAYTCFFGVLQFLVIALVVERDASAWIFNSGGEVFTIFYAVNTYHK